MSSYALVSLQTKIINLKLEAALALRHANGWQRLIDQHGEEKAEAFYRHLGLNHLPAKSVEFDGLQLRRQPRATEAIAVKGVHQAQESSKEAIGKLLLSLRTRLISDGLKGVAELDPASYHELTINPPLEFHQSLRDRLIAVYAEGRALVVRELGQKTSSISNAPHKYHFTKKQVEEDEFDDLDLLTDVTLSRIANDTQARIIGIATRLAMLGTQGSSLITATQTEMNAGSVSYIDRAATGLANRTISLGRSYEAKQRRDQWSKVEYSALLDNNVCGPCLDVDGETADSEDDLIPAPNPACEGYDNCRCFYVFVQD
jgi:hypothetical protein